MKVLLNSFHLNGHTLGFYYRLKSYNHIILLNANIEIYDSYWAVFSSGAACCKTKFKVFSSVLNLALLGVKRLNDLLFFSTVRHAASRQVPHAAVHSTKGIDPAHKKWEQFTWWTGRKYRPTQRTFVPTLDPRAHSASDARQEYILHVTTNSLVYFWPSLSRNAT